MSLPTEFYSFDNASKLEESKWLLSLIDFDVNYCVFIMIQWSHFFLLFTNGYWTALVIVKGIEFCLLSEVEMILSYMLMKFRKAPGKTVTENPRNIQWKKLNKTMHEKLLFFRGR